VSIAANLITITPALKFTHYGAPAVTINNIYGILDTRTSVGHLTRSIKIVPGADKGWGYQLIGYGFFDGIQIRTGQMNLTGV
jgi:hypothetical protein